MRAYNDPKISEQFKKLKQVPVDTIRKFPSVVVNVPIGELSLKDSHRSVYVLGSTLIQVKEQANRIVYVSQEMENCIKKLIEKYENQDIKREEILNDLKEAISPEFLKQKLEAKIKEAKEKAIKDEKVQTPKNV